MEQTNCKFNNSRKHQPGKTDLLLCLTRRCALDCRYCFMDRERKPADITPAILNRAIRLLFSSSKKHISLQLFGGEPAMVPSLVFKAITIARRMEAETGKHLEISLTTSLLGWTDEACRFLSAAGVSVLASLDGDKAAQTWRSGIALGNNNYIRILTAARRLSRLGCRIRINMVVPPARAHLLAKNFAFIKALGLGDVQIAYALTPGWTKLRRTALLRQLAIAKSAGLHQDFNIEPVLTSPQIFCDCDGSVSVGCAAVLEKKAPALAEAFKRGKLADFSSLDELTGTRKTQKLKITSLIALGTLPEFIQETLALGYAVKALGQIQS